MRRRGLRTAIAKLEAKARLRRLPVPIIFTLYADEGGGDVLGFVRADGAGVDRSWQDSDLNSFAGRASRALGGARILWARYARQVPPQPAVAPEILVADTAQAEPGQVSDFYQTTWLGRR